MDNDIRVYDLNNRCLRKLDKTNYDDDLNVGIVYFDKEAIATLKRSMSICGYYLIDKNTFLYDVDIRKKDIAFFEGTFNKLPDLLKEELKAYNISEMPKEILSPFFFQWQLMGDWDAFSKHGSLIELCSTIVDNGKVIKKMQDKKIHLLPPNDYSELCELAQNLAILFDMDFYNKGYIEESKYILDSLLHGYRINLSPAEVETYGNTLCIEVLKGIRDGRI